MIAGGSIIPFLYLFAMTHKSAALHVMHCVSALYTGFLVLRANRAAHITASMQPSLSPDHADKQCSLLQTACSVYWHQAGTQPVLHTVTAVHCTMAHAQWPAWGQGGMQRACLVLSVHAFHPCSAAGTALGYFWQTAPGSLRLENLLFESIKKNSLYMTRGQP